MIQKGQLHNCHVSVHQADERLKLIVNDTPMPFAMPFVMPLADRAFLPAVKTCIHPVVPGSLTS